MDSEQNKRVLIVFIHGLGDMKDSQLFNYFSSKFQEAGFETHRYTAFDYSARKSSAFTTTPFSKYVQTLNEIIEVKSKFYQKIFIFGHSFGCLIGLHATEKIAGLLLLEPSLHPLVMFESNDVLMNTYRDFPTLDDLRIQSRSPKMFIFASLGGGVRMQKEWGLTADDGVILIPHTDHNFSNFDGRELAFKYSMEFIKRIP